MPDLEIVWVNGRPLRVPDGVAPARRGDGPRMVVRFTGPIESGWVERLNTVGAAVRFWCPPHGACVDVPARATLVDLEFVAGAIAYDDSMCSRDLAPPPVDRRPESLMADVVCFSKGDRARVERDLARLGIRVLDRSGTKLRIVAPPDLQAVRGIVGVKLVDPARVSRLSQLVAATTATIDADHLGTSVFMVDATGDWLADADGRGEIVSVVDTGLDTGVIGSELHADFAGRVERIVSWPVNPSWSAFVAEPGADDGADDVNSGHGTHVAGVVLGSGEVSGGRHRGLAPGAHLVFQAIEQWAAIDPAHAALGAPGYYLAGRPLDLRELLAEGAEAGATIHVNAWGDPARGAYTDDAYEADLYLHEHPQAVVLFAAGNGGSDADGDREVDPGSLDAPATGKNVLSIGATEGPVYGVGYQGTWVGLENDGRVFANVDDLHDGVSGDPDRMALMSATGPTLDGRTKPDLCAPGTNIAGPRSSRIVGRGWGYANPAPSYMYLGGTSTAVAVAGGAIAVLRQCWRQHRRGRAPKGPTLKAIAIAGAAPVRSRDGMRDELRSIAGFGRVAVTRSLPLGNDHRLLVLSDATRTATTGSRRRWALRLDEAGMLRIALVWYDAPGERLVNDIDLVVEIPGGELIAGNHPPGAAGSADRTNTVEVVDLPDAGIGTYVVTVSGMNVPAGPQPYALVARGPRTLRTTSLARHGG